MTYEENCEYKSNNHPQWSSGRYVMFCYFFTFRYYLFQRQTDIEEGFQIRKQIRKTPKESSGVQLQKSTESSEEKGVHLGRRRQRGT